MQMDYRVFFQKQLKKSTTVNTNVPKISKTYQDFVKFHYTNQEIFEIQQENLPLQKISDPIVLCWSQDLDESNSYSDYVQLNFNTDELKPTINSLNQLKNEKQTLHILFAKNLYHDRIEHKNLFECLMILKNLIGKNSLVLVPPCKGNSIKPHMINEIITFIFPRNEIKIFNTTGLIPKNQDEIQSILKEYHDSKLAGHLGFNRTYSKIKERYYWSTMKQDIRKYVKICCSCQLNKKNFRRTKQPIEITTTSETPFERLTIDVVGPLPLTKKEIVLLLLHKMI